MIGSILESEKFQNFFRRKFNHSYIIKKVDINSKKTYLICDEKVFEFDTSYIYDLVQEFKKEL